MSFYVQTWFRSLCALLSRSVVTAWHYALISCFPWVDPWDTPRGPRRTQGGMVQFGISFFLAGEGSCLVLDTTLLDHGDIPTGFVRASVTGKCFTWYHGRCVKMSKKRARKPDKIFANEKHIIPWSDEERLKKVVHVAGVRTSRYWNAICYLSIILCPLPRGFC